ncbi:MAG: HlyD family efflux transporter periplasmic adaptor subunit [Thermonemataceae bacterium]|nr:HlyD family efflux transporter periplasmic adaptor subunit [Thermonemataceae bacterium]
MKIRKNTYLVVGFLSVIIFSTTWFIRSKQEETDLLVPVKKGDFQILVMANGELEAQNSLKINAPEEAFRSAKVFQVKIADLVPEGTFVKKGDYVATLDKVEMSERLRTMETEINRLRNQFNQNKLDTSLLLRAERNELTNWKFLVQEKELALKTNQYETPAQVKQLQIELEKAKRGYQQSLETYRLKQQQALVKIGETTVSLAQEENKYQEIRKLTESFVVKAPADGLVIYHRDWNGQKKAVGAYVSAWDAVVATLPDMSTMVSRAYVNEIDISKIKEKQKVIVKVDALPHKNFEAEVLSISTIGEQKAGSQIKVFEVKIQLLEMDKALKPTMTTANTIICETIKNVYAVPLDALYSEEDNTNYVFAKKNNTLVRQQVRVGKSNNNEIIVLEGLEKGDLVYLSIPEKARKLPLQTLGKK